MITVIYGGAGCGKTYYLINEMVKQTVDTPLSKICMMTLTRNARREFVERATDAVGGKVDTERDMRYFGTQHSIVWHMLGLTSGNIINKAAISEFSERHGGDEAFIDAVISTDSVRRGCMLPCTQDGFRSMRRLTGVSPSYKNEFGIWQDIADRRLAEYGSLFNEYMIDGDLYDYTRSLEHGLEMFSEEPDMPFDKLFVDEFQDFSPIQYKIYKAMSKSVDDVWICGDDLQVIYRFSGATPEYLLNTGYNHRHILPKTYRYGAAILDYSGKFVDKIDAKLERDIEPASHESYVHKHRGKAWLKAVDKEPGDTAYLTRTNRLAHEVARALDEIGVMYGYLGKATSATERLIAAYNALYTFKQGDVITPEAAQDLVGALPAHAAPATPHSQRTLTGEVSANDAPEKRRYLINKVSTTVKHESWLRTARKEYSLEVFGTDFMYKGVLDIGEALQHIKGMTEFMEKKNLVFDRPISDTLLRHHVGTIHKFKGNEADNVFMFTQLPYPISDNVVSHHSYRDDERRTFYVAATRARINLHDVSSYFVDGRGSNLMNVSKIL